MGLVKSLVRHRFYVKYKKGVQVAYFTFLSNLIISMEAYLDITFELETQYYLKIAYNLIVHKKRKTNESIHYIGLTDDYFLF